MSTFENVYLYTGGLDPETAAQRIAAAVNGQVTYERGMWVVTRAMSGLPEGKLNTQVTENMFYENPPSAENPSATDLYDMSCDIWCTPRPDEFQQSEAALIFNEITAKLEWPALLIHNEDQLISAWAPALGRRDFQPGTTPDKEHQELWQPYADPAGNTRPEAPGPGR